MNEEKQTILASLELAKDNRKARLPIEIGRFKHLRQVVGANYSSMILMNLLFVMFLLPIIALVMFYLPYREALVTKDLNFSGNIGIGYPGALLDPIIGRIAIYNERIKLLAMLIPCFIVAGLGLAGLFYCSRNYLWGAKVKVRVHYFRGIKFYALPFMLIGLLIGAFVFLIGFSVLSILKCKANQTSSAGFWVLLVFTAIFALIFILYLMFALPMKVNYKAFKFKQITKNSTIFVVGLIPLNLIMIVLLGVPSVLLFFSIANTIFLMVMLLMGFSLYSMAINSYAQYNFDLFINDIYEQLQKKEYSKEKKAKDKKDSVEKKHISYKNARIEAKNKAKDDKSEAKIANRNITENSVKSITESTAKKNIVISAKTQVKNNVNKKDKK